MESNSPSQRRTTSFGQLKSKSFADRFGIWLSQRSILSEFGDVTGKVLADIGCGYHAEFGMLFYDKISELVVADLSLSEEIKNSPKVASYEGYLPQSLEKRPDQSINFIILNNILEHLFDDQALLDRCYGLLKPGGKLFVNVPSWRGKLFLETSAFTFKTSPAQEMNDHKMYYDPRDIWPLMVRAGFIPEDIRVRTHKFGLNTKAIGRKAV